MGKIPHLDAVLLLFVLAVPATADILHVPADNENLQEAVWMVGPGDTVLVAPGLYPVNLVWPSTPGIRLLSEAGAESTVLDGGAHAQVLGIYTGVDSSTVIRGFTIRGGIAEGT